jgi:hypothetical protein
MKAVRARLQVRPYRACVCFPWASMPLLDLRGFDEMEEQLVQLRQGAIFARDCSPLWQSASACAPRAAVTGQRVRVLQVPGAGGGDGFCAVSLRFCC